MCEDNGKDRYIDKSMSISHRERRGTEKEEDRIRGVEDSSERIN